MKSSRKTILICPNAFKGSLTALEASRAIASGLRRSLRSKDRLENRSDGYDADDDMEGYRILCLPLADGGDGTLETLVAATGGTVHRERVRGPHGTPVEAAWGQLGGASQDTAVIEMAEAAGLRLLADEERDPRITTTYGVGQLMRAAVQQGCRRLLVGIGGSATNDGGAGMAQALGVRLLDANGDELPPGGAALTHLARIDRSEMALSGGAQTTTGASEVEIVVACDVDNPLCGSWGASAIYGPQKGATPAMVAQLDSALAHYADLLEASIGRSVRHLPGAGAAGGLGAGLLGFCNAKLMPGTEMVLEMTGFNRLLEEACLVITGEGRLDGQTGRGKVVAGVARHAQAHGVPVIALAGSVEEGAEEALRGDGLTAAFSIVEGPTSVTSAMQEGYRLLEASGARIGRLLTLWDSPHV